MLCLVVLCRYVDRLPSVIVSYDMRGSGNYRAFMTSTIKTDNFPDFIIYLTSHRAYPADKSAIPLLHFYTFQPPPPSDLVYHCFRGRNLHD